MNRQLPRGRARRRGAALVEFSLVLPLLVLLLFATIETCSMVYLQQSLKIAAYEGARIALVPGSTPANVQSTVTEILEERRVKNAKVTITPANYESLAPGAAIKIETSAPAQGNSLVGALFYGGRTLTGAVEMMKEL